MRTLALAVSAALVAAGVLATDPALLAVGTIIAIFQETQSLSRK